MAVIHPSYKWVLRQMFVYIKALLIHTAELIYFFIHYFKHNQEFPLLLVVTRQFNFSSEL